MMAIVRLMHLAHRQMHMSTVIVARMDASAPTSYQIWSSSLDVESSSVPEFHESPCVTSPVSEKLGRASPWMTSSSSQPALTHRKMAISTQQTTRRSIISQTTVPAASHSSSSHAKHASSGMPKPKQRISSDA